MGRQRTTMPVHGEILRAVLEDNGKLSNIADKLGVTRQVLNGWLSSGRIPPRKMMNLARMLDLTNQDIGLILLAPTSCNNCKKTEKKLESALVKIKDILSDLEGIEMEGEG